MRATFVFVKSPHGMHEEPLAEPASWLVRHSSSADWSVCTPFTLLWGEVFVRLAFLLGAGFIHLADQSPSSLPMVSSFPSVVIKDAVSAGSVYILIALLKFSKNLLLTVSWKNVGVLLVL